MKVRRKSEVEAFEQAEKAHEQLLTDHREAVERLRESHAEQVEVHQRAVELREAVRAGLAQQEKRRVADAESELPEPEEGPEPEPPGDLVIPEEPPFTYPEPPTYTARQVPYAKPVAQKPINDKGDTEPVEAWEIIDTPDGEIRVMPGSWIVENDSTGEVTAFADTQYSRHFE